MARPTLRSTTGTSPATLFVLVGLAKEPKHGLALWSQIIDDSVGQVKLGVSTIYALLKELERDGLVDSAANLAYKGSRVYGLTPRGREVLRRAVPTYERAVQLAKERLR